MDYDLVTVGGGLAGAALGASLAAAGARVLIVEREEAFRDRVRGEALLPWGVPELGALGLSALFERLSHPLRTWSFGEPVAERRDLVATTPARAPCLCFYHPMIQEALLGHAAACGAEVRRGASVTAVAPGATPTVTLRRRGREELVRARMVVGADGRRSQTRAWGGFDVQRDPPGLVIAGVLLEGLALPEDEARYVWQPPTGGALVFPLGQGRFRCYAGYPAGARRPLSGDAQLPAFVDACVAIGARPEWYAEARQAGPLATFDGADTWAAHPYRDGVALVGDAAAASDPNWGCGLALALRDARALRDALLAIDDWDAAGHAYAAEHDRFYGDLHRIERWMTELHFAGGAEADARRARVLPLHRREPERGFDIIGLGPDAPSDEAARRRFFGED